MSNARISGLITMLEQAKAQHGDLVIGIDDHEWGFEFIERKHVKLLKLERGPHLGGNELRVIENTEITHARQSYAQMTTYLSRFTREAWEEMDQDDRDAAGADFHTAREELEKVVKQMGEQLVALEAAEPIMVLSL